MKSEQEVLAKLSALKRMKMSSQQDDEIRAAIGMKIDRVGPGTVKLRVRTWKGYLATSGAVVVALGIAVAGITSLPGMRSHRGTQVQQSSGYTISANAPAAVNKINPNQIRNVSIDGWGPGAAGNSIQFLYNPFGLTKGRTLLTALQHGKVVSEKDLTHDDAIGGQAWLVLHLYNGHSLKVEQATETYKGGAGPAKNTFWVSLGNQSSGMFIEDASGLSEQVVRQLFQGSYQSLSQKPEWLKTLSGKNIGMVVDGNHNDTWFQDHSLPAIQFTASDVISALKAAPVIDRMSVDFSNVSGPGSYWRTNSITLKLQLKDGSTIHVIGPYTTQRTSKNQHTTPVFKVTYATKNSMTSVFVKDATGKLTGYWNQLGINEQAEHGKTQNSLTRSTTYTLENVLVRG